LNFSLFSIFTQMTKIRYGTDENLKFHIIRHCLYE
jgi:hypothetical protein